MEARPAVLRRPVSPLAVPDAGYAATGNGALAQFAGSTFVVVPLCVEKLGCPASQMLEYSSGLAAAV